MKKFKVEGFETNVTSDNPSLVGIKIPITPSDVGFNLLGLVGEEF